MSQNGDGKPERPEPITVGVHRLPGQVTVVQVTGDLIGDWPVAMHQTVREELSRSPTQLIVDLSNISSIDTTGINALASAAEIAGEADISFCLVDPDRNPVGAALESANLIELFEIFDTVDEAIRAHPPASDN